MIPILIKHEHDKPPIGVVRIIDGQLFAQFVDGVTQREFFEIFSGAGAQFLEVDGDGPLARVKKARIFEFSLLPVSRSAPG